MIWEGWQATFPDQPIIRIKHTKKHIPYLQQNTKIMSSLHLTKRKQPSQEEVLLSLSIADAKAKDSLRYNSKRKKQKQENAKKQYNKATADENRAKNAKKYQTHKNKYAELHAKFDQAKNNKNDFPFNTQFGDFPLRFKAEHKHKFLDLMENGYVVLESPMKTYYLTAYLECAAKHNTIYKNPTSIFDTVEEKMPRNKRQVQKLRAGHPVAQNTEFGSRPAHEATNYAKQFMQDAVLEYLKPSKNQFVEASHPGIMWSQPIPDKVGDILLMQQQFHADDATERSIFQYSMILNTGNNDVKLHVCPGSHRMTHEEQWQAQVHATYETVTVKPGFFVLFSRNLIHAGAAYRERQDRFFCYIDMGPNEWYHKVIWPHPDKVWKYYDPSKKASTW